jgi:hypothetical protein
MESSHPSLYPISFSIPEEKIVSEVPPKRKILSSLIPGKMETYIYQTESDYYKEYQDSLFATTTKKAGWDCMRHYEIMANGCIPYFPNIENCPTNTMALLPKDLFIKGNTLYEKYRNKSGMEEFLPEEWEECRIHIESLLDFTRRHLTTCKMAKYILDKSNHANVSSILYLSGDTGPDYLRCVTLHGFKSLFGSNCHDFPKIPHIYKNAHIDYSRLYGKGITYTNLLGQDLHDNEFDQNIETSIREKKYDIVIYGSYHRGMPFYDLVRAIYKPDEILLLCGEDEHYCNYRDWIHQNHCVFVRELV